MFLAATLSDAIGQYLYKSGAEYAIESLLTYL